MDTSHDHSKASGERETVLADAQGDIETVNPAAELMFGWSAAELAGENFRVLIPRSSADNQDTNIGNYLDTDERRIIGKGHRVNGLHKDGTLFPIEITVTEMELTGRKAFAGIIRDVTDRVAAEEALRLSNELMKSNHARLEAVLENMPEGLVLVDEHLNVAVRNDRYYEMLKLPRESLGLGTPFEAHLRYHTERNGYGPGDVNEIVAERMEATRNPVVEKFQNTLPGGTVIDIHRNPIPGGGFVMTFADITEHKAAEDALRISNERLEAHHERLEQELNVGRDMQAALMPSQAQLRSMEEAFDCRFDAHFETSSELGGDFWGLRRIDEHRLGIFLVDFSGHGVGAALNTFRLHSLMAELPAPTSPAAHLDTLNRLLVDLIPRGQFATMFYGIMDTKADSITYSAAAAPSPLIGMADGEDIFVAEARGKPLGISADAKYTDRHLAFPNGAFLFLYSDALIEGRDEHGDMLGTEGLSSLLSNISKEKSAGKSAKKSSGSPLGGVLDQFNARSSLPLQDDLTAIWLSR